MRAHLFAVLICAFTLPTYAADVAGSQDFPAFVRFPHSEIARYDYLADDPGHEFITGSVDKIRGVFRARSSKRVEGARTSITYRVPDGIDSATVFAHFREQVNEIGNELYACRARDCGRSNIWANDVFGVSFLYGTDGSQLYLASEFTWEGNSYLLALYVVERGNRQVFAHLDITNPVTSTASVGWQLRHLAYLGEGATRLPVDDAVRQRGTEILKRIKATSVLVVCHLYETDDMQATLQHAQSCADEVAKALQGIGTPKLFALGVGPAVVRPGARPRVEFVFRDE